MLMRSRNEDEIMKKNIVVVTYGYPCQQSPNQYVFVKKLMEELALLGENVYVIHPIASTKRFPLTKNETESQNGLHVYEIGYPAYHLLFPFRHLHTALLDKEFYRSVLDATEQLGLNKNNSVLYAHFLNAGMCISKLAEELGFRAYCAVGESTLWSIKYRSRKHVIKRLSAITKYIAVSTDNKNMLLDANITSADNITVLPNGVDTNLFYPRNKQKAREELGLPKEETIGIFVGAFIERKGASRVAKAMHGIDNVRMIYIGKGAEKPEDDNALYIGEMEHSKIPLYLSAADFFVLPTQNEGCCNAILEAISCGLPIISSDCPFNDDILDDTYSIRIDPNNVALLHESIIRLASDKKGMREMSENAHQASLKFGIHERAEKIRRIIGVAD